MTQTKQNLSPYHKILITIFLSKKCEIQKLKIQIFSEFVINLGLNIPIQREQVLLLVLVFHVPGQSGQAPQGEDHTRGIQIRPHLLQDRVGQQPLADLQLRGYVGDSPAQLVFLYLALLNKWCSCMDSLIKNCLTIKYGVRSKNFNSRHPVIIINCLFFFRS